MSKSYVYPRSFLISTLGLTTIVLSVFHFASVTEAANLFVSGYNSQGSGVLEYTTGGSFVREFVTPGSGGLSDVGNDRFGPDGNLYVGAAGSIKKYDGSTGAYLGDFATVPSYALDVIFDSQGRCYACDYQVQGKIYQFSNTGTLLQTFTSDFSTPSGLALRPNGNLLVTNTYSGTYANTITELDPTTGSVNTFATGLGEPIGIAAGPDGRYYVANYTYAGIYGGTNPDTIQVVGPDGGVSSTWNTAGDLHG
jgi:sugar lactone lactonase YvrE